MKNNVRFIVALLAAIWFALFAAVWAYLAALFIAFPAGIVSFILWRQLRKSDDRPFIRAIPIILIIGATISMAVLVYLLIYG